MAARNRPPVLAALALLLAAFGVRVYQLGGQSLWNDEGSSYAQATRSFRQIAVNAAADIHPPLYYWGLRVWRGLAGETEFALRYPSLLAGVLAVALVIGVGRRLHPTRPEMGWVVALIAAGITALNTFQITYSQEARMYAGLVLWGVGSTWALVGFLNRPGYRRGATLGVINALGLWTQYAFPLVMLAQLVIALVWLAELSGRRGWRVAWRGAWRYAAANILALALFAPLLPTALRQVTTWPNTGDAAVSPLEGFGVVLSWFAFGVTAPEIDGSWVAIALILALFGLHTKGADHRWRGLAPAVLFLVPTIIFLGGGLFREGNLKFLLPSAAGFALAVGQGVAVLAYFADLDMMSGNHNQQTLQATRARQVRSRGRLRALTRLAATAAVLGLGWVLVRALPPLYTEAYARDDYRAIVAQVRATPGAAVILNAPGQQEVYTYYDRRPTAPILPIPAGINSTPDEIRAATLAATEQYRDIFLVLWGDAERDPDGIVQRTLAGHAYEVGSGWYGDVRLIRYVTQREPFAVQLEPAARFGDHITLTAADIGRETLAPGEALPIRLTWETDAPLTTDYRVFVQLLDENGALVAGRDAAPAAWTRPTTTWEPGEAITDRHALLLPKELETFKLTLIVGLYNSSQGGERLPILDQTQNYLTLSPITATEGEK